MIHQYLIVDPAISGWLLVPGLVLCALLVAALYRVQRRLAPPRLVRVLTTIRVMLIAMVFALLLRPLGVWSRTVSSSPTLWVLVDQSLSMAQKDAQAAPAERLRWADAMGLLPLGMHSSLLARNAAEVSAARSELEHVRRRISTETPDEPRLHAGVVDSLSSLQDRLRRISTLVAADADAKPSAVAQAAMDELRLCDQLLSESAARPWDRIDSLLAGISAKLQAISQDADTERVRSKPVVLTEAIGKVSTQRRADLLLASIGSQPAKATAFRRLLENQQTRVLAFGTSQKIVGGVNSPDLAAALKTAAEPTHDATDLAAALRFVSEQIAEGEPASVVVLSDGRQTTGGDSSDAARHLAGRGVRVSTLAVGSRQLAPDAAIESVDAPDWIFKDDTLRVSAALRLDGLAGKNVTVEFRRAGTLLDTKTIQVASAQAASLVVFEDRPSAPDVYPYEITIAPIPGEAVLENNRQSFRVAVKKDKLQVLVIEDQPRWEYRYLMNYLKRDNRVHVQSVLLEPAQVEKIAPPSAIKASPTNDRDEAQVLPETLEEWSAFDLIVVGDVPPEFLTAAAQTNIARAVSDRGATAIVIAGPLNMPGRFGGSPLGQMLPVESSGDWPPRELSGHLRGGFRILPAPEGATSVLSQFGPDPATSARLWSAAPQWYWHAQQTHAKSAASVIWQIAPVQAVQAVQAAPAEPIDALAAARAVSMLATMPLGMGRVMYLASDSTWRLRQVGGENVHERFWGQVIRWVAASDMPAGGKFVRFGAGPAQYVEGQAVQVSARIFKKDFSPLAGGKFGAIASAAGRRAATAVLEDSPQSPGMYRAQLKDLPPGTYDIALQGDAIETLLNDDPSAAQKTLQVEIASQASLENRNVNTDRAALSAIARDGDGIALDVEDADVLADYVSQTRHDQTVVRQFGMFADPENRLTRWAHWGFLGLFIILISIEWVLRKAAGLV